MRPVPVPPNFVCIARGVHPPVTAGALALVLFLTLIGCSRTPERIGPETIAGKTMGTTYAIKLFLNPSSIPLEQIGQLVEEELESVNVQMSTYREDSEISRFNASDSTDWFPVSKETAQIVQLSLEIYEKTGGRFDVTVGPLVNLWGFGPAKASTKLPDESEINALLASVGSDKLQVRHDPPALRKQVPDLQIDLSAIAKGHGVDRLAAVLDNLQIDNYLVEVGGEIRAKGRRGDDRAWQVGIESPNEGRRELLQVIQLRDLSMATSGDYRNLRYLEDGKFSHFIDPQAGWPVRSEIASATVLAEDCATADAIATGLMSSDREHALKLVEVHDWSVLLIVRQGEDFETIVSPGFQQRLEAASEVGDRLTQ